MGHIKEKISEMIIHATLVRAALEAAVTHCKTGPEGAVFPDELYTNAGKYHAAASYSMMVRHLHDIGGGSILTAPSVSDLENPETGNLIKKYMRTMDGVDGEYRTRLFRAARLDRRRVRRLAPGHQHPGRRRPVRAAHRHAQALRPREREGMALAAAGMDESDVH